MSPLPEHAPSRHHAVVVVETGCDRLAWRRALASAGAAATTVVQRPGEDARELADRAAAEVDGSTRTLVIVAGPRIDAGVLDARTRLLRAFAEVGPVSRFALAERRTIQLEGVGVAALAMEALAELASDQLRATGIRVLGPSPVDARPIAA